MRSAPDHGSAPHAVAANENTRRDRDVRDAPHGERCGADLPEGTATDVRPPEGTSVDAPGLQGIHRPAIGPGAADFDESDRALPNRDRTARKPSQPTAPGEQSPLRRRFR
jgi:hypothetical protein